MSKQHTILLSALLLSPLATLHAAGEAAPNWDRDLALEMARNAPASPELELTSTSRPNKVIITGEKLREVSQRSDLSEPARDRLMYEAAKRLAAFPADAVPESAVDFLANYESQTLVAHEEAREIGVPLYPVRATMAGVRNQWRAEAARDETTRLIRSDASTLLSNYAANDDHAYRRGVRDAIRTARHEYLANLVQAGLPLLSDVPEITGLVGAAAIAMHDADAFALVVARGDGHEMVNLLRKAANVFDTNTLESIRNQSAGSATPTVQSVMTAVFSADGAGEPAPEMDPSIESWTEEDGVLGLGYPVPIPVDTPIPFDGFRTYNGLHTRHQQLMSDTNIIHGEVVGTTHLNNPIWAYRIGDADRMTWEGLPEGATITNGGIHAREWQTPEVVTGIMELFADRQGDNHFYDFLLENVNMIVIPVQNVDGFMQTQRYPSQNWLFTNPSDIQNDPQPSPRDGRMRRKNMRGVDTILTTQDDHLFGIDLNRNNGRFWATNPDRSSPEPDSIVYHGEASASEPETQALIAAAGLGPVEQLRLYNDVHSFTQVLYWHRTSNIGLNTIVGGLMANMSGFNAALPNGSFYFFDPTPNINIDAGFGMTHEYFADELEVAAFGIEVEPNGGGPNWGGEAPCGGNYGGLVRNCHDGFILPESEIRRVRNELSQSISANFYMQAGPPSISAIKIVDVATQAVVYEAEWDPADNNSRELHQYQIQPVELGREYSVWIAYDRPMRWRTDGVESPFPGQPFSTLEIAAGAFVDDTLITGMETNDRWLNTPGGAPNGYFRYQDDAFATNFIFDTTDENLNLVPTTVVAEIRNSTTNMTGQALDADPSTPVSWADGGWTGWENSLGVEGNVGGADSSYSIELTSEEQAEPFVVEPGTSAAWFDLTHDGEGFMIEILEGNRAVMYWFTYDNEGNQAWYIAVGDVIGNRLIFNDVLRTSGGIFGPGFDPNTVVTTSVGTASFLYSGCDTGTMVYNIDGRKGRLELQRLSTLLGVECGGAAGSVPDEATRSGSWFTASQSGHGFVIEVLDNGQALVYWFTYDLEGNQAWFFGVGTVNGDDLLLTEVFSTLGPVFGPDFDPAALQLVPWGSLQFNLGCEAGGVNYDGRTGGFPNASLPLSRLSTLAGLSCEGTE